MTVTTSKRTFSRGFLPLILGLIALFVVFALTAFGVACYFERSKQDTYNRELANLNAAKKEYQQRPSFDSAAEVMWKAEVLAEGFRQSNLANEFMNGAYKRQALEAYSKFMPILKKRAQTRQQRFRAAHIAKTIGYQPAPFPELLSKLDAWEAAELKRQGVSVADVQIVPTQADHYPPPPGWKPRKPTWQESLARMLPRW